MVEDAIREDQRKYYDLSVYEYDGQSKNET